MEVIKEIIGSISSDNIYVISFCAIAGAVIRIIEKRKLRKKGILKDE